jgi:hypothetical protein
MVLREAQFRLRGKPDYVLRDVERGRPRLVALELKPSRRSRCVLESDAVQVAAYTLLLQATYGDAAASFGYLRDQSGRCGSTSHLSCVVSSRRSMGESRRNSC